jgi:toxin ParE1/3/4
MKVELHPAAAEEFYESAIFYESRVSRLGGRFIEEFDRLTSILSDYPYLGIQLDTEFRRLLMLRFPYSLIYLVEPNRIWIVAVAHQRRKPGYWRRRIRP